MSLRLKTFLLFGLFILVVAVVFILQFSSYDQLSYEVVHLNDSTLPQQQYADLLYEGFERIDSSLQFAVLTAEFILVDNAREEIQSFKENLQNLEANVPDLSTDFVEKLYSMSNNYFTNALLLAENIIKAEQQPEASPVDFDQLSEQTSVYRDTLRTELVRFREQQNEELITTLGRIASESRGRLFQSLIISTLALVVLGAVLFFSTRTIVSAITQLSASINRITSGDYETVEQLRSESSDEIGQLTKAFNEMIVSLRETTVSRNYFDRIIQSMADMLFVCDESRNISLVNRAVVQQLKYEARDIIDQPLENFIKVGEELLAEDTSAEARQEAVLINRNGDEIPVVLSSSAIYLAGSTRRLVFVASNITAQKRAEEAERLAKLSAIEKQQLQEDRMTSISILVSGVAHEINNPNHMILSNIAFLKKAWQSSLPIMQKALEENTSLQIAGMTLERANKLVPEALSIIKGGSERIKTIVKELRDYAKSQPAEINQNIDLNEVVRSATTLMGNMIKKSTDDFFLNLSAESLMLQGNYQKLEQVIINLIANACQALPAKSRGMQIATSAITSEIVLTVADQGTGISAEDMKHIFDPFFTTKRDSGGTGLGLSISQRIISEHGGTLKIASEPGAGTTVTVYLPGNEKITA